MATGTINEHQTDPSNSATLTVSERTPLISRTSSSATAVNTEARDDGLLKFKREDADTMKMFFHELRTIISFAIPVFGAQILEYSLVFVSVFTLGHLSTTALAAISLATMTTGVTGMSIIHGFCSSLDTLLPPAWTSEQPGMMRVWIQRVAVGIGIQILMIWTLWWNAESILLKLRQDSEVARLAARYLRVGCVGLPAFAVSTTMRRWYSAQELFSIPTKMIMVISPINLAINYTLVYGPPIGLFPSLKLGFIGAPISTATCQWLLMILNVTYAYNWVDRRGWYGVDDTGSTEDASAGHEDIDALKKGKDRKIGYGKGKGWYGWCWDEAFDPEGLLIVARLGLSGIGQLVTEWWAWECLVLAASQFGPTSLAAQSALGTTAAMLFQPALGVAIATPMRIGNLMGEKNARRASVAANAAIILTFAASVSTSLLLIIFRNKWGRMFTDDDTVNSIIASILPIIAFFQICDGNAAVTGGIMRAKAQQFVGAMINITGYWMIALPVGGYLGFKTGLGLKGLWIGYTFGLLYSSVVGSRLAFRTDWERETRKVVERMEREKDREAEIEGARGEDQCGDR